MLFQENNTRGRVGKDLSACTVYLFKVDPEGKHVKSQVSSVRNEDKKAMSGVKTKERHTRTRDDSSQRRKTIGGDKEKGDTPSSGSGQSNIRTRLSTGTIHVSGTQTFKDIKSLQASDDSNDSQKMGSSRDPPAMVGRKRLSAGGDQSPLPPKKRKIGKNDGSGEGNLNDYFCWMCHKEGSVIYCELCPRVYHKKCLDMVEVPKEWVCPECEKIMRAECTDSRSRAMAMISTDTLCFLLKFALNRMKHLESEPFMKAVDPSMFPHYSDYVFHSMDLGILEKNIKKKMYGSTEAFLADTKWILHNCIVFNGLHHKLTSGAKTVFKICRHEMSEIEVCPDCYLNSCVKKNDVWFCEPCREPHPLVWAKLKGYPFWPAKALREKDGLVDVRFFGAHDRSWVGTSQVFMLSEEIPTPMRNKRQQGIDNAMEETRIHIAKLKARFGTFVYAPFRTPYDKNKPYSPVAKHSIKSKTNRKNKLTVHPKFAKTSHSFNVVKRKTIDPKSSVTKTASAVRLKYNSIITTRKAALSTPSSGSGTEDNQELSPMKDPDANDDKDSDDSESDKDILGEDPLLNKTEDVSEVNSPKVIEDKVLDSSEVESETTSPIKPESFKVRLVGHEEKKDSEETDRSPSPERLDSVPAGKEESLPQSIVKESTPTKEVTSAEVVSESDKIVSTSAEDSLKEEDKCVEEEVGSKSEKLDTEHEQTSTEHEQTSTDGRQTPTDSVDGEVMFTAKGGKVTECVRESDSVEKKEEENTVVKSDKNKCLLKNSMKETPDPEPSLLMEVESECDSDQLIIDLNDETSEHVDKIITSSRKTPPKSTSSVAGDQSSKTSPATETASVQGLKTIAPKPIPVTLVPCTRPVSSVAATAKSSFTAGAVRLSVPGWSQEQRVEEVPSKKALDVSGETVLVYKDEEAAKVNHKVQSVIQKCKNKILTSMKYSLDEMCKELVTNVEPESGCSNKHYQQELEKLRWIHLQEVAELKHNFKLTVTEMRSCWDAEKQSLFKDISKMCEKEKNKAIAEVKKKQWCAHCGKEAIYYCCWNTSYCTYECQQTHWPEHMPSCMQTLSANPEPEKPSQSKPSPTSPKSKEETVKKTSPSASHEWSEKEEAIQAQRTFNLAPPTSTSANTTNSTPPNAWKNRARDNLEQVLRRQQDHQQQQPSPTVNYIPPQLAQTAGNPVSFIQGGQSLPVQYIQHGPQSSQAVHLPPSSVPNYQQPPPQVRLHGFPMAQSQPGGMPQGAPVYPMLRSQPPPGGPNTNYGPRSQIFLAPTNNPRGNVGLPGQMHFQIRPNFS